jgi:hypothetical protein
MRSIIWTVALATISVNALPSPRNYDNSPSDQGQSNISSVTARKYIDILYADTEVLQFALTLEHLENAFYQGALDKFDDAAFKAAGLPPFARGRFSQVAAHEASHVKLLQTVLGDNAPKPCEYSL